MNPKEDPQFNNEDKDISRQQELRENAEGVVNELKKFLSDLNEPAPAEEAAEPPVPEPEPNPIPEETEDKDDMFKGEIAFPPEKFEAQEFSESSSEKDNQDVLRMGDAGLPPKKLEPDPQAEMDASDNVPDFPAESPAAPSGGQPDDEDFWEGNVLGWPEEKAEKEKKAADPVEEEAEDSKPEETLAAPEPPPFDPFSPDPSPGELGNPAPAEEKKEPETKEDFSPESKRPVFDPFAPDPSDPPSVPSSPEDPKRGAQISEEVETPEPVEEKPAHVFKDEKGPREIDLAAFGGEAEAEEEKASESFVEKIPDPFAEPDPGSKEAVPDITVGENLIPEETGPDLDELRESFPKGPSADPFPGGTPSPYATGETPPAEKKEQELEIERTSSFMDAPQEREADAGPGLMPSETLQKEPHQGESEKSEFDATTAQPENVLYVACLHPKGEEGKAKMFLSRIKDLGVKLRKPLEIQEVYQQEVPQGKVDIRGWESSAEMAGSNFMFILVPKADQESFRKQINAGTNGDWKGRIVCLEHLGMRTLYADILIQLGRAKK